MSDAELNDTHPPHERGLASDENLKLLSESRNSRAQARKTRELLEAIRYNNISDKKVEQLLKSGTDPNAVSLDTSETALDRAIETGNVDIVGILLDYKANPDGISPPRVDEPSQWHLPPLHAAIEHSSLEIVQLLILHGANLNILNKRKRTPLHNATRLGKFEIAKYLLSRDGVELTNVDASSRTILHDACAKGWDEIVEKLLESGTPVQVQDDKGLTPLHDAAISHSMVLIDKLIAAGALVNAHNKAGSTPIFGAVTKGNIGAVKQLLERGASLNIANNMGETPLHLASARNWASIAELLVKNGASVNARMPDGSTPLHEALRYGASHVIDILLDCRETTSNLLVPDTGDKAPSKFLEPVWADLLHLPRFGERLEPNSLSLEVPPNSPEKRRACEEFEGAVWPWPAVPFVLATPTVQNLLYAAPNPVARIRRTTGPVWIHLPANNRSWIEDTFRSLYDPKNADSKSSSGSEQAPLASRNVLRSDGGSDSDSESDSESSDNSDNDQDALIDVINVPVEMKRKLLSVLRFVQASFSSDRKKTFRPMQVRSQPSVNRVQSTKMVVVALPIIDIDIRRRHLNGSDDDDEGGPPSAGEKHYDEALAHLQNAYNHIDPPVSLDQYYHESIDESDLNARNQSQVISSFIARQKATQEKEQQQLGDVRKDGAVRRPGEAGAQTPSRLEAGLVEPDQDDKGKTLLPDFRQRIITIPRFWIWKVDESTIVTSFPQHWAETERQGPLPRAIWTSLMKQVLQKQNNWKEEAMLTIDEMLNGVVQSCLEYRPSFRIQDTDYTYADAFASETAYISRVVTRLYEDYTKSLGSSVTTFSPSIRTATDCLISIDHILNEMTMIRRVFRDQVRILKGLKQTMEDEYFDNQSDDSDSADWGRQEMRSTEDKDMIARLMHVEKDARIVRESLTTLLELRQRQVQIEMAISSGSQSSSLFRQSSILFVFTIATVLFAPLSWVSSLMALKIDDFSPDTWTQGRVLAASFGSVLGTIVICACSVTVYLRHQGFLAPKR